MNNKIFLQRFNQELSTLGLPEDINEKIKAIAKVFGISRHLAHAIIFSNTLPPPTELNKISEILEVCPKWLSGQSDKKKPYS